MRFSQYFLFAPAVLILTLASCAKQEGVLLNPRVAIVELDNQAGAADGWVGREMALVMTDALRMRKELSATIVSDAEGWRTLGVGRYVTGNYRREKQGIRVRAQLVDAATSRVLAAVDEVTGEGQLAGFAAAKLAGGLMGGQTAGGAKDEASWKALAISLEQPGSAKLAEFVAGHAGFEAAYPLLAERLVREGKLAEAEVLRAGLKGESLYAAQLGVVLAGQGPGRLEALQKLSAYRSEDPALLVEIGTRAGAAGQWGLAAQQYQVLARLEPMRVEWWNSLGYAEANQNRLAEAVAALNQYRKLAPNEPNVIDSLGEVHYMNRKFAEAARYFEEQSRLYPAFQNGAGWRKAAFAHYFAGDVKAADARFEEWVKRVLGRSAPSVQVFQRAMWLARTKRVEAAVALLKQEIAGSADERKLAGELHLAMLRFGLEGARPAPEQWRKWGVEIRDGAARNEFSMFALLVQPAANAAALKARIEAALPQPQLAALKTELLVAAEQMFAAPAADKPKVFALPNALDGPIDAVLLRTRLAVLP